MKCVLFAGGSIADYSVAKDATKDADIIICADAGILHAEQIGVVPDYWVGDLDSADANHKCGRFIKLPTEKDDTDTMSAARIMVQEGVKSARLFGCTGTRLDHTLGNLFVLKFLLDNGITATVENEHNKVLLITEGNHKIYNKTGCFLSLLPFCCEAEVSLSGVKYPLNDYILKSNHPIGVSNQILNDYCDVKIKKGTVAVFLSCD